MRARQIVVPQRGQGRPVRRVFHPAGGLGVAVGVVAGVSFVVWAVLEVVKGESL